MGKFGSKIKVDVKAGNISIKDMWINPGHVITDGTVINIIKVNALPINLTTLGNIIGNNSVVATDTTLCNLVSGVPSLDIDLAVGSGCLVKVSVVTHVKGHWCEPVIGVIALAIDGVIRIARNDTNLMAE